MVEYLMPAVRCAKYCVSRFIDVLCRRPRTQRKPFFHSFETKMHQYATGEDPGKLLGSVRAVRESIAGVLYRQSGLNADQNPLPSLSIEEQRLKLMRYERLFFQLDEDASLQIDADECELLLSYAVLDLDPLQRAEVMKRHDVSGDGKLNRFEFCKLCVEELWGVSHETLQIAVENMTKARSSNKRRNNAYWNRVANKTDEFARAVVPSLYALAMMVIFSIDMTDEYDSDVNVPMFSGFGPVKLPSAGIVAIIVYLVGAGLVITAWLQVSRAAASKKQISQHAIKLAMSDAAHRATTVSSPSNMFGSTTLCSEISNTMMQQSSVASHTRPQPSSSTATGDGGAGTASQKHPLQSPVLRAKAVETRANGDRPQTVQAVQVTLQPDNDDESRV